jgi:hypothetical protein
MAAGSGALAVPATLVRSRTLPGSKAGAAQVAGGAVA